MPCTRRHASRAPPTESRLSGIPVLGRAHRRSWSVVTRMMPLPPHKARELADMAAQVERGAHVRPFCPSEPPDPTPTSTASTPASPPESTGLAGAADAGGENGLMRYAWQRSLRPLAADAGGPPDTPDSGRAAGRPVTLDGTRDVPVLVLLGERGAGKSVADQHDVPRPEEQWRGACRRFRR